MSRDRASGTRDFRVSDLRWLNFVAIDGEKHGNSTSVNNVLFMQIVNGLQNLLDCLRGILFSELAFVANSIEQLPTSSKLSDDIEFVLQICQSLLPSFSVISDAPLTRTNLEI